MTVEAMVEEISMRELGYYLALLEHQRDHGKQRLPADLTPDDLTILEQLRERLAELEQWNILNRIVDELPAYECRTENPILENHQDFFLYFFVLHKARTQSANKNCMRVFRHLNYCYRCFKAFSAVSRTFFNTKENLNSRDNRIPETTG
ncbi:MAG: hypothetical protein D6715_12960 [Calditrichaeota bacterium]|nr:MAG: hypothetical protein D6715_12960 [Calditrichota bacterium]